MRKSAPHCLLTVDHAAGNSAEGSSGGAGRVQHGIAGKGFPGAGAPCKQGISVCTGTFSELIIFVSSPFDLSLGAGTVQGENHEAPAGEGRAGRRGIGTSAALSFAVINDFYYSSEGLVYRVPRS